MATIGPYSLNFTAGMLELLGLLMINVNLVSDPLLLTFFDLISKTAFSDAGCTYISIYTHLPHMHIHMYICISKK